MELSSLHWETCTIIPKKGESFQDLKLAYLIKCCQIGLIMDEIFQFFNFLIKMLLNDTVSIEIGAWLWGVTCSVVQIGSANFEGFLLCNVNPFELKLVNDLKGRNICFKRCQVIELFKMISKTSIRLQSKRLIQTWQTLNKLTLHHSNLNWIDI